MDSSSSGSYPIPVAPQLFGGISPPLCLLHTVSFDGLNMHRFCAFHHNYCEVICALPCYDFWLLQCLKALFSEHIWVLEEGCVMYIKFSPEHFIVFYSLHVVPPFPGRGIVFVLTAIYCKENLFSWGLRDALIYEYSHILLRIILIEWTLSKIITGDSPYSLLSI